MPLVAPPQCPQCSTPLALTPLWGVAKVNAFRMVKGTVGLHCPACGIPLRLVQARIGVALTATCIGIVALAVGWRLALGRQPTDFLSTAALPYAVLALALVIFYWRSVPQLAAVRFALPEEDVDFPLEALTRPVETGLRLDDDAAADADAALVPDRAPVAIPPPPTDAIEPDAVAADATATEPSTPDSSTAGDGATAAETGGDAPAPWTCPACHEETPGEFLICWKCQAPHPGFSLAPATPADEDEDDSTGDAGEPPSPDPRA